jgi:hypothetical protein
MANNSLGLYSQFNHLLPTAFHNLSVQSTGGGGSSQTLAQTLTYGNSTGGNDIIQTSGDSFKSSSNSDLKLELDGSGTVLIEQNNYAGKAEPILSLRTNDNTARGSTLEFFTNSTTPVAGDLIANIEFNGNTNPVFNKSQYGVIECQIKNANFGSMASQMNFVVYNNNLPNVPLIVEDYYITPLAIKDTLSSTGTVGQVLSCNNSLTGALQWITIPNLSTGMTATGGTITTYYDGGTRYTAHYFTSNSNFTITSFGSSVCPCIDVLVVGGGGGGGGYSTTTLVRGGGGGAGCVIEISDIPLNIDSVLPQTITVAVGTGGNAGTTGATGTNGISGNLSSISIPYDLNNTGVNKTATQLPNLLATLIEAGGGGGGASNTVAPSNGVSITNGYGFMTHSGTTNTTTVPSGSGGGGAAGTSASGAQSTAVFNSSDGDRMGGSRIRCGGFGGGTGNTTTSSAAGGGGASSKAGNADITQVSGGSGWTTYWLGSKKCYAGGGSGGTSATVVNPLASDIYGAGHGGALSSAFDATSATANSGSGGGGGATIAGAGNGGSGFVIIRYKS